MMDELLDNVNRIYWDSLGFSQLSAFLDLKPENSKFVWHLKRKIAQFFVFFFSPLFILLQVWGILSASDHSLKQLSFDVSFLGHNVQNAVKMVYWLTHLTTVRSLCLDFSQFHVNRYRPSLSSWLLKKESDETRNFVKRCFMISYGNLIFWVFLPTIVSLSNYFLYVAGIKEGQETYIPRLSPARFPFDMSNLGSRLFVGVLEYLQMIFGFIYFQPIDMFLSTTISMVRTQFFILNSSMFLMPAELEIFWNTRIPVKDTEPPMDMRLFVEDHQRLIRYGVRLRKFLNPILGIVTLDSIAIICNMTIVVTELLEEDVDLLELLVRITAALLVILTCLVVFYTFSSMCGMLKEAEESVFEALYVHDWYGMSVQQKKNVIFMQKQTKTARKIPMLNIGDMSKSTFLEGLRAGYTYYNFMKQFK